MNDDLDALLNVPEDNAMTATRRAEILAVTTGVLRRRVMIRRVASAVVVAFVFLAGGGAGWLMKPEKIIQELVYVEPAPAAVVQESPRMEAVALTPRDLELQAELADEKPRVAQLYREAGDKYLAVTRDYEQAARCYRLHLNAASRDERQATANDSWLLLSMKSQSLKE